MTDDERQELEDLRLLVRAIITPPLIQGYPRVVCRRTSDVEVLFLIDPYHSLTTGTDPHGLPILTDEIREKLREVVG